jgi:hypothetical protein
MGSPDTPRREIEVLLAEAGLHRDPLATLRAPARQHRGSALGLHARSESVLLRALTPVRLESALGHEKWLLLIRSLAFRQTTSINDLPRTRQTGIGGKPAQQPIAIPHIEFRAASLAKFSCSHHQFMLDLFLSISGAHIRFRVPRTNTTKFLRAGNFRSHLPHTFPHSAELSANSGFPATRSRAIILCTTHVAVINSLLDNTKSSRSNPVCAKKFLREVFHAAKIFCASMPPVLLTEIFFVQAPAPSKREALCTN